MPKVEQVIRRLFPEGTRGSSKSIRWFPIWPPDLFAATATLANLSGCYCGPRYTRFSRNSSDFFDDRRTMIDDVAGSWRNGFRTDASKPKAQIQEMWEQLLDKQCGEVHDDKHPFYSTWCDAVMTLLIIADEASKGIGFIPKIEHLPLADLVFAEHLKLLLKRSPERVLKHLPRSICRMVPPEEACVQPKSRTAQVGCTLRSLSHHLALLPPAGEVVTTWSFAVSKRDLDEDHASPLNLLIVPFPYQIDGSCFVPSSALPMPPKDPSGPPTKKKWRFFGLEQRWLRSASRNLTGREISAFLVDLVHEAERDVGSVDGIIMPELALNEPLAAQAAKLLARETKLELFFSGIAGKTQDGLPVNSAFGSLYSRDNRKKALTTWKQSKHHRWMLDRSQICRYHLGDRLNPESVWWEEIAIGRRQCGFWVIRGIASLTTLICEDLARIDPVQTIIRSVGPSLVVALLMDGPQWEKRWGGRYATVLADDPGSAVLVVTSLGLVRRSTMPGEPEHRDIALWKGAEGETRELKLPRGHHALLLTLSPVWKTNYTLDGRSDEGTTLAFSLSGVRPIKHRACPTWAQVD